MQFCLGLGCVQGKEDERIIFCSLVVTLGTAI